MNIYLPLKFVFGWSWLGKDKGDWASCFVLEADETTFIFAFLILFEIKRGGVISFKSTLGDDDMTTDFSSMIIFSESDATDGARVELSEADVFGWVSIWVTDDSAISATWSDDFFNFSLIVFFTLVSWFRLWFWVWFKEEPVICGGWWMKNKQWSNSQDIKNNEIK